VKGSKIRVADTRNSKTSRRRKAIIVASFMGVAIAIAAAIMIYRSKMAPFRAVVLEVNDTSISMGYFLKRASLSPESPTAMLETLISEEIIKQVAPYPPHSIRVSENDVDLFLREIARGDRETISESEFDVWYRQQLEETRFTKAEYRDLVRSNLLRQRLAVSIAEKIAGVAEQVHLFMLAQSSMEDALDVKKRLDEGEDFYRLARKLNLNEQLKEQGGDLGWYPREALPENVAREVFDRLEIGQYSEPLVISNQYAAIILVAERSAARQINEQLLQTLKSNALERWLEQELTHHRVIVHGLKNGYDEETEAWIQWQLQKMRS